MSQQAKRKNAALLVLCMIRRRISTPTTLWSEKIKRGPLFQRCSQIRWVWAPLPGSGKSYSLPCCRCPSLGASVLARTLCQCSGWSFGWYLNVATPWRKSERGGYRFKCFLDYEGKKVLKFCTDINDLDDDNDFGDPGPPWGWHLSEILWFMAR